LYSHGLLIYLCSSVLKVTFALIAFFGLLQLQTHLVYFLEAV